MPCRRSPAAGGGAIVNISSTATLHGNWGYYCVAKAAEALTRSLAVEAAPHGIRVNAAVRAGSRSTWTGFSMHPAAPAGIFPVAARSDGEPVEIAAAVAFLASDDALITGQMLIVDGASPSPTTVRSTCRAAAAGHCSAPSDRIAAHAGTATGWSAGAPGNNRQQPAIQLDAEASRRRHEAVLSRMVKHRGEARRGHGTDLTGDGCAGLSRQGGLFMKPFTATGLCRATVSGGSSPWHSAGFIPRSGRIWRSILRPWRSPRPSCGDDRPGGCNVMSYLGLAGRITAVDL
jgi:hypothetical protein